MVARYIQLIPYLRVRLKEFFTWLSWRWGQLKHKILITEVSSWISPCNHDSYNIFWWPKSQIVVEYRHVTMIRVRYTIVCWCAIIFLFILRIIHSYRHILCFCVFAFTQFLRLTSLTFLMNSKNNFARQLVISVPFINNNRYLIYTTLLSCLLT